LEQIETAISGGFSHAQVDPQVEAFDDAAGVEFSSLEAVHPHVLVVAQRANDSFMGASLLRMARVLHFLRN
jgi:hypothetical protein